MDSLISLEEALLEENSEGRCQRLPCGDRKTANDLMTKAGEAFGFSTTEIHGIAYTHMGLLSKVFGCSDASGLGKLVERYQLPNGKLGSYGQDVRILLRKTFKLSPNDGHATFVTWDIALI